MSKYVKKHTRSKNWTQEEYDTVLQMDLEGYTQQEIADRIGRTKSSVKSKMYTLQYRMDKEAIINKEVKNDAFEPGAVYLISENNEKNTPQQHVEYLPSKFVYVGKIQGQKDKHVFRSIRGKYLLTFTNAQFYGFRFEKEGEDYAKRIRENERRNQKRPDQEGEVPDRSGKGSKAHSSSYVEQTSS